MSNRTLIYVVVIILAILVGGSLGYVNYNYKIDKCQDLKSSQSNYDFDYKLETNAQYNEDCYFLTNHPFVLTIEIFLGSLWGATLVGIVIFVVSMIRMFQGGYI